MYSFLFTSTTFVSTFFYLFIYFFNRRKQTRFLCRNRATVIIIKVYNLQSRSPGENFLSPQLARKSVEREKKKGKTQLLTSNGFYPFTCVRSRGEVPNSTDYVLFAISIKDASAQMRHPKGTGDGRPCCRIFPHCTACKPTPGFGADLFPIPLIFSCFQLPFFH